MSYVRNRLAVLTALAFALAPAPGPRAAGPPPPPKRAAGGLDEDKKPRPDLAAVRAELEALRDDTTRSLRAAHKTIDGLKEDVARLKKEVEDLRKRQPPSTRISRSPPAGGSGTIRLVNDYAEAVDVVVNGRGYRLEPGETRWLRDQAPGRFTYEVPGVRGPVDRELRADETFTIRVHPR